MPCIVQFGISQLPLSYNLTVLFVFAGINRTNLFPVSLLGPAGAMLSNLTDACGGFARVNWKVIIVQWTKFYYGRPMSNISLTFPQ